MSFPRPTLAPGEGGFVFCPPRRRFRSAPRAAARARLVACCLLGWAALALALRAEDGPVGPPAPSAPESTKPTTKPTPPVRSVEDLKNLPPGTVIVVCDDLKKGLDQAGPKSVVLTAEEYQKLLDRLAQAPAAAGADRPAVPSVCRLTGQVRDNVVHFKVLYEFPTSHPGTVVALGCRQGFWTQAALDGKTPMFRPTDDGPVLEVEKPGDHQVSLEMDVALTTRGTEHGLELDLPRAPITTLDLELTDPAVKEVRLKPSAREGRPLSQDLPARVVEGKNRVTALLGAVGRLDLSWKGPAPPPAGPVVLSAEGHLTVHVGENHAVTGLTFTLKPLRGQTAEWRFLLPGPAKLDPARAPDPRIQGLDQPDRANPGLNVLHLKGPTAEPLEVALQLVQTRTGSSLAVGPFAVLGAFPHTGSLLVAAPPHLRLTPQVRGEPQVTVTRRELTDEERRREPQAVLAFNYRTLLAAEGTGPPTPPLPPFVQIDVEQVRAGSATETAHTLKLTDRGWRLTTDITVTPQGADGVDRLEIYVPPRCEEVRRVPRPDTAGARMEVDNASGLVLVTLPAKRTEPFHVGLEGFYPLPPAEGTVSQPPAQGTVTLELPRPRRTIDRGGQVTVQVPRGTELVAPQPPAPAWEGLPPGKAEYGWHTEHMPERVTVSWRMPRPEVAARLVADVTVVGGQARVHLQCIFPTPPLPAQVLLWVPESLSQDRIQLAAERGRPATADEVPLPPKKAGFRAWLVVLTAAVDREHPLALDYSFALPEPEAKGRPLRFAVPLIVPEQTGRAETSVRVWTEPGSLPVFAGGGWEDFSELGDRDVAPSLCLRSRRPEQAPVLRLDMAGAALALVSVERALVQVQVDESNAQTYRARFLLPRVLAPYLDLEFPAPLAGLAPVVRLQADDQVRKVTWAAVDENGQPAPGGKVARVPVPEPFARKPLLLDVVYQLSPDRAPGSGPLQAMLYPPALRGDVGRFPVRCEVRLPAAWVPIYPDGDFAAEQRWSWRGKLLAPWPPAQAADLEGWLFGGYEARFPRKGPAPAAAEELGPSCLVCWRSSPAPFRVWHAPELVWLLACSAALLFLGVALFRLAQTLPRSAAGLSASGAASDNGQAAPEGGWARALFWPVVGMVGLLVVLAALLWPGVLGPVLYGCEPAAAVLLFLLGIYWLLHQRYRRQLVFLPGFARAKSGSSLVRAGGSSPPPRPRGEPSTVDAPQPPLSSKQ
jgi:hypothetical protein